MRRRRKYSSQNSIVVISICLISFQNFVFEMSNWEFFFFFKVFLPVILLVKMVIIHI